MKLNGRLLILMFLRTIASLVPGSFIQRNPIPTEKLEKPDGMHETCALCALGVLADKNDPSMAQRSCGSWSLGQSSAAPLLFN